MCLSISSPIASPARSPVPPRRAQNICLYPLEDLRIPAVTSLVKCGVFCLLLSTTGMSTNSWFHLRGKSCSPSSLTAEATTDFTTCEEVLTVLGESPASTIFSTSPLRARFPTEDRGTSPRFGRIHTSRLPCHDSTVAGAIGL